MRRPLASLYIALLMLFVTPLFAAEAFAQRSLLASVSSSPDSLALARIEAGFKAGNPGILLTDAADPIDIAIYGHGASYSRSQAALVLLDFFRRHPPEQVTIREEVAAEDRRSVIGHYYAVGAREPASIFVRMRMRDGRWEVRSIRIEQQNARR